MTEAERIGLDMGMAIAFGLDSFDVEHLLSSLGVDISTASLTECQEAIRQHVGSDIWRGAVDAIRKYQETTP